MFRTCTRAAALTFLLVTGLWQGREVYEDGDQYPPPWLPALTAAVIAAALTAAWHFRRRTPSPATTRFRRKPRPGDPGE